MLSTALTDFESVQTAVVADIAFLDVKEQFVIDQPKFVNSAPRPNEPFTVNCELSMLTVPPAALIPTAVFAVETPRTFLSVTSEIAELNSAE